MIELVLTFKEDIDVSPNSVPHFHYPVSQSIYGSGLEDSGAYHRILQYTGDHELAESVLSWAENAPVGEVYDTDELLAEISETE